MRFLAVRMLQIKHIQSLLMTTRYGQWQRDGQTCTKMAADSALEDHDDQGHNPFMVRHAQVWSRASTVQLGPGGSAAVQCFNLKQ